MPNSIALFTWTLSDSGGAITNIVSALVKEFWKLGIKRIYVVYLNDEPTQRVYFPQEVHLISLGVHQTKLSSLAIAKFLRTYEPDIFISLAFLNISSILGRLLAGNVRTKLIISQHNSMIYQAEVEHSKNWLFKAQLWLAKYLYPKADGLVATTQAVLQELTTQINISLPKTKTKVIPNILDIDEILLKTQERSNHPWLNHKDTLVIISVARLAKQKNFPLLLNAIKIVRQQLDVKLIIFGEGKERKELENIVKQLNLEDSVSLPGYCSNPYKEMAKADGFVLSSEEEAFGLVLVEAMASGTTVIATDAIGEGPRTILEDNRYGLLVPSNNTTALAEAMIEVLTDFKLRDRLINAGKERCQIYKPEIIAKEWLSFFQQLK
jgi:glycosyltransferase involved in cell wall biosynthesis